jgi:hypothetical protein
MSYGVASNFKCCAENLCNSLNYTSSPTTTTGNSVASLPPLTTATNISFSSPALQCYFGADDSAQRLPVNDSRYIQSLCVMLYLPNRASSRTR